MIQRPVSKRPVRVELSHLLPSPTLVNEVVNIDVDVVLQDLFMLSQVRRRTT